MNTLIDELRKSVPRSDAYSKITGKEQYLDDVDFGDDVLHAYTVRSAKARAKILKREIPALPEGYYCIDYTDVPGENALTMIIKDWPPFAEDEVRFIGQTILLIVGPDKNLVYELGKAVHIEYEELTPAFTLEDSKKIVGGAIHGEDNIFISFTAGYGDVDKAFTQADKVLEETYTTAHQEHLYLEVNGAVGLWIDGKVEIYSSTQCPFYVRHSVAPVLGYAEEDLTIKVPSIGGGFGGKEHYPDVIAATVAVAAYKLKRTVKCILDRKEDMAYTVKRQPSSIHYKTALDKDGNIIAIDVVADMDGGAFESCSRVITQRCTYTASGVYNFPAVRVLGRVYATNKPPSCAFRGFGGPQAVFAVERMMDNVANYLKENPAELRRKYFVKQGDITTTGGKFHDRITLNELLDVIKKESDFDTKLHSQKNGKLRGIGIAAFPHGVAFTGSGERDIIKAKLRLTRKNGRVTIYTSNTEIGQGLHTTFRKIAAHTLNIPLEQIDIAEMNTATTSHTGPTVASRSITIVGYLIQEAAKKMLSHPQDEDVEIIQNYEHPPHLIPWDTATLRGDAYPAWGLGVNAVEVEVDPVTYEIQVIGAWGAFDCGYPIDEKIVEGQIKGGMAQALGWGFLEKLHEKEGKFLQVKMSDYMVPTALDLPRIHAYTVTNPYEYGPSGAKGVGEITFDGAAAALAGAVENALGKHFTGIPILSEEISQLDF